MNIDNVVRWLALGAVGLLLAGCQTSPSPSPDLLAPTEAQMKLRSYQSRTFDVLDRDVAVRAVIAALQDLGFIIERANGPLGLVTAARFQQPRYFDVVGVTVTVRPKGEGQVLIRANAIYNNEPVTDPKAYENFFATVERSLSAEGD